MSSEIKAIKISQAKFSIFWTDCKEEAMILDFQPFIEVNNLSGNFCILHFQAKPMGLRQWGVYDSSSDSYSSFGSDILSLSDSAKREIELLSLDENKYRVRPSAAMVFRDCILQQQSGKFTINGQ